MKRWNENEDDDDEEEEEEEEKEEGADFISIPMASTRLVGRKKSRN